MNIVLINKELNELMAMVESKKDDIAVARSVLEKALTYQFQRLALGLCSYVALHGKALSNYCLNPLKSYFLHESDSMSLDEVRQQIAMGVVRKEWESISIPQLCNIEIRLFNKRVKLWNDIEINEQLALVGSSMRFYFAGGSDQLSIAHIKSLVGYENNSLVLDGRFIFGNIGPVSATYFGPLFYFTNEVAVSPYFSESEPGFTIGDTVILRDVALEGKCKDTALLHELGHAFAYGYKDGLAFGVANWRRWIERDICRFLIDAHTFQEIEKAIGVYQKATNIHVEYMLQDNYDAQKKFKTFGFCDFQIIIDDLIKKGKIFYDKSDKYYSPIYRGGTKWTIF